MRETKSIFINAGWRTGGTYIWSKFRRRNAFMAFCEPFHETLSRLTENDINNLTAKSWPSHHPFISLPYQKEFLPVKQRAILTPLWG